MTLEYTYPVELKYEQLELLTDTVTIHKHQQRHLDLDAENQRLYRTALKTHAELIRLATALYGERSKQVKYLSQNKPVPPMDMNKKWRKLIRRFEEWEVDERKRQSSRASRLRRKDREDAAMTYLEKAGRARRVDFDRYSCLRDAEALRRQVEIAAGVIGGHLAQMPEVEVME